MKRVLVTGATGGLGRNAVDYLLARGVEVVATGRNTAIGAQVAAQGAQFHAADLAKAGPGTLRQLLRGCDTVWHCAALSAPWGALPAFEAANVQATANLAQAADSANVARFVHISTPALYFDFQHRLGVREDFVPRRYVNHYAATKARAEATLRRLGQQWGGPHLAILRPRAIFGRYDQVLLPRLLGRVQDKTGRLLLPHAGQTLLDMTYAENVVQAMHAASVVRTYQSGQAFNITNGEPMMVAAVLQALFAELGRPLALRSAPAWLLAAAARAAELGAQLRGREPAITRYSLGALAYDMTLDITRARQQLGYAPAVPMAEAIRHTAAWLLQQGKAAP